MDWWKEIDCKAPGDYPCDQEVGKKEEGDNCRIVTALSGIVLADEEGEKGYFPLLYQSSMNPDFKQVKTLTLTCQEGQWEVLAPYQEARKFRPEDVVRVEAYLPEIIKPDCLHCTNCGRCSY
ncbi:MAG: hypothetical protein K6G62_03945 [Eubacterium sp.]|nr:hypothetical protein [Eubacterium sp.]